MSPRPIVLLVDDHKAYCESLRLSLHWRRCVRSVTAAHTLADGIALCMTIHPQVVLADIGLPDGRGWDLLNALPPLPLRPRVVMVSAYLDAEVLLEARRAPIAGFVAKGAPLDEIVNAVNASATGEQRYYCRTFREAMAAVECEHKLWRATLTPQQLDDVRLLARGANRADLARQRHLKAKSTDRRVERILQVVGLDTDQALVRKARLFELDQSPTGNRGAT
jgi:DNA-binding NarL/FixJ family response regulator